MIGYGEEVCGEKMADAKIGKMDEGPCGVWLRAATMRTINKGLLLKNFQAHKLKIDK